MKKKKGGAPQVQQVAQQLAKLTLQKHRPGFKQAKDKCWFTSTLNLLVLGKHSSEYLQNLTYVQKNTKECPTELDRDLILRHIDNYYKHPTIQHTTTTMVPKQMHMPTLDTLELILRLLGIKYATVPISGTSINPPKSLKEDCSFLIYCNPCNSTINPLTIPKIIKKPKTFLLDSCSIYMTYSRDAYAPHSICGYKDECGIDYVYDSNMAEPLQIEWSSTTKPLTTKLSPYSSKQYPCDGRLTAKYMYIVYVKKFEQP